MRRNHTREFKLQCCRQVATGQKRPAQICGEHNLSESVLLRWRKDLRGSRRGSLHRKAALRQRSPEVDYGHCQENGDHTTVTVRNLLNARRSEELGESRYVLLRDQNDRLEMLREERRMLVEELERESRERRQLQISAQPPKPRIPAA